MQILESWATGTRQHGVALMIHDSLWGFGSYPAFGPAVDEGYGVCYHLKPDHIYAGMTAWTKDNGGSDLKAFASALEKSLTDVYTLLGVPAKL